MIGPISVKNPNTGSISALAGAERQKQLGSDGDGTIHSCEIDPAAVLQEKEGGKRR